MLKYSTASKEDRDRAVELSVSIFKDNMKEQFQGLFGDQNLEHMFLAKEDDEVVSMVNYYPSVVKYQEQFKIRTASIGSVCTQQEYRRKNIAYELLELAEEKMLNEKINVAIISGSGGIYQRFGANEVGNVCAYKVTRNFRLKESLIDFVDAREEDINAMYNIYQKEELLFERTKKEFEILYQGQTYPDTFADYPVLVSMEKGDLTSYVIFQREFSKRTLLVKEFAGNRKHVLEIIKHALKKYRKLSSIILFDPTDQIYSFVDRKRIKYTDLHASIKIVNPYGLWSDLSTYINLRLTSEERKQLSFKTEGDICFVNYQNDSLVLSVYQLNQLVFGSVNDIIKQTDNKEFKIVLSKLFPIPFVWVNNLNYQ